MPVTVAVITRTHNRSLLLRRALSSVAAQTFTDYVHLVVNDAGDLATVQADVAALDDTARARVEVINNEVSSGREAAVNPGFRRAAELEARYVVVADDDDTWEPQFLETCVEWLDQNPKAIGVATQSQVIYEEITASETRELSRELLAADKTYITIEDVLKENFVPPIAMMFRTNALEKLHGWREDLPVLADWDFTLRLLLEGPLGYVLKPLAHWHHRQQQDGDLGNSIVTDADGHRDLHALIRDDYLRSPDPDLVLRLGIPLLMAHYQVEQEAQIVQRWDATRNHLDSIHESLQAAMKGKSVSGLLRRHG